MRFERLDLLRYGGFQDRSLTFPNGKQDLHILYGDNEAGKSTTLAAIRDFLFGFPHHVGADWVTAGPLLRIGGCLERDGTVLSGIRRRGRNQTFYMPDDETAADDALLRNWLGNLDAKGFEAGWALDHTRLRNGGEEMRRLKDDAGLQILAAGLGLGGVSALSAALEKDMNAEWRKGGSKSAMALARRELTDLTRDLRADAITPRELTDAQKAVAEAEAARQACENDYQTLSAQLRDNARLRTIAVPYRQLVTLEAELAAYPVPDVTLEECARAENTLKAIREEELACQTTAAWLRTALAQIEELGPVAPVLAEKTIIARLTQDAVALAQDRDRKMDRQERIRRDRIWLEQFWSRHGSAPCELPDVAALERLQKALDRREQLVARIRDVQARLMDAQRNLAACSRSSGEEDIRQNEDRIRHLRLGIDYARALGPIDRTVDDRRAELEAAIHRLDTAFLQLAPWTPPGPAAAQALEGMALPPRRQVEETGQLWKTQEDRQRQAQDTVHAARHESARLKEEQCRLEQDGQAVSREQLLQARQNRDSAWEGLQDTLRTGHVPALPVLEAFEVLVREADTLADRRHAHAELSGRLNDLKARIREQDLLAAQALDTAEMAETGLTALRTDWNAHLQALGTPLLPPVVLLDWMDRRDSVLALIQSIQSLKNSLRDEERRRAEAMALLEPFTGALPHASLSFWMNHAITLLGEQEAQLKALREKQDQQGRLRDEIGTETARLSAMQDEQAIWEEDWKAVCTDTRYPGQATRADLEDIREARTLQIRLPKEEAEFADIEQRAARFDSTLTPLLERYGQPSLEALCALLEQAREAEQRRQTLRETEAGHRKDLEERQVRLSALQADLSTLHQRLCKTEDDDFSACLAQARARAERLQQCEHFRTAILQAGNGRSLETLRQEAAQSDVETLEHDYNRLESQAKDLNDRRSETDRVLWEARQALSALVNRKGAHETAERIQTVEAELTDHASRYVSLRLQHLLLRRLVEDRRQKAHGPLLARAGALFSRLTLNHYAGLAMDDDGGDSLLLAGRLPGDRALVPVHAMSEGTRDQLYLALRLASVEQALDRGIRLPFLADDLFITFDDRRTAAGLRILAELSEKTQVLFFTHHTRISKQARELSISSKSEQIL
ncbi:YhaN family protein [Gluconobacter morbifer]|uniref:YhaN AAA domain-containing protein n=1 Tax=Gluconobacter morbifer G707 TaxID=1088869 RepID=G6XK78_9PROT|nr:YhaN family protein [Gluconobacter morbifer]EHH67674.1 hypothetical protein GMO_18940 [Gluconobacter morbifer G707]